MNTSRTLLLLVVMLSLGSAGCASKPRADSSADDPLDTLENAEANTADEKPVDPYETFNRKVFAFNMTLDRWVLKPVSKGYKAVTPDPVEAGVGNFFLNLLEVPNIFNDVLQWKWKQAGNDSGRLLINSTVGIVGLFDVARHTGLERGTGEDFGQTLVTWGVPEGPYIMLPILGPRTVSDAAGIPVNWVTHPLTYLESRTAAWSLYALDTVHTRAGLLETEKLASGDLYVFLRDAYLQRRKYLLNDGVVEDDFGDFSEDSEESFDF